MPHQTPLVGGAASRNLEPIADIVNDVLQAQEGVVMKEHLELAVTKPTSTVSFALRNDAEDKERILRAFMSTPESKDCASRDFRRQILWQWRNRLPNMLFRYEILRTLCH